MVGDYVEELNAQLNRWETIKKWEILAEDLSIESGELTPSLKVKRNVVEKQLPTSSTPSTLISGSSALAA